MWLLWTQETANSSMMWLLWTQETAKLTSGTCQSTTVFHSSLRLRLWIQFYSKSILGRHYEIYFYVVFWFGKYLTFI
jgi:hypothetical protein